MSDVIGAAASPSSSAGVTAPAPASSANEFAAGTAHKPVPARHARRTGLHLQRRERAAGRASDTIRARNPPRRALRSSSGEFIIRSWKAAGAPCHGAHTLIRITPARRSPSPTQFAGGRGGAPAPGPAAASHTAARAKSTPSPTHPVAEGGRGLRARVRGAAGGAIGALPHHARSYPSPNGRRMRTLDARGARCARTAAAPRAGAGSRAGR